MRPSAGARTVQFFRFALWLRDPSGCIGLALQLILVGLTRSKLDSGPFRDQVAFARFCAKPSRIRNLRPSPQTKDFLLRGGMVYRLPQISNEGRQEGETTGDLRLIKARVLINLPPGAPGGPPRGAGRVTSILKRSLARFARKFFGPNSCIFVFNGF